MKHKSYRLPDEICQAISELVEKDPIRFRSETHLVEIALRKFLRREKIDLHLSTKQQRRTYDESAPYR